MKEALGYCSALSNKTVRYWGMALIAVHYALVIFVASYESVVLFIVGATMIVLTMGRQPSTR